jgi:hypothetical protein
MSEREFYREKLQAQLDEWKADVARLRARAAGATADAQVEMGKHVAELEKSMHEAGARLAELAAAGEGAWDSARKNAESTWDALRAGVSAAAAKFKEEGKGGRGTPS